MGSGLLVVAFIVGADADVIDLVEIAEIEDLGDVDELGFFIAVQADALFVVRDGDLLQEAAHFHASACHTIEVKPALAIDPDHGVIVGLNLDRGIGAGQGYIDVLALFLQHRGDEKENKQQEYAVDQRRHGDLHAVFIEMFISDPHRSPFDKWTGSYRTPSRF